MRNENTNAKKEFLEVTKNYKVVAASISFGYGFDDEEENIFKLNPLYTTEEYENFLKFLDREYDAGYGGQNLYGTIFCESGIWMDRGEYDGSEWWCVNEYPDMKEHFGKEVVLRYERNKKLKSLE